MAELKMAEDKQAKEEYEAKIKELTTKLGKVQSQFSDTKENCAVI